MSPQIITFGIKQPAHRCPAGGRLFFCAARPPDIARGIAPSPQSKGEIVSDKTETTNVAKKAAGLGISLDAWAVALALGFALLVWLGWIKRVPW
jgi:hypothetical protein